MVYALKTVEAVYEKGYLRPLEPIEQRPGLVYIVTIVDLAAVVHRAPSTHNLRGKYHVYLSSSNDFARRKKEEKALEQ